ncbi:MAG: gamma-glutamylcyclotransferase [Planctomycetota bacterium]
MPLIFQYGSNCDTSRLNAPGRLAGDAEDGGPAETIEEYDIAFDVWSQGNGCAASGLGAAPGSRRRAWGVLYEIPADLIRGNRSDGRRTLAEIEGRYYEEQPIRVRNETGEELEVTTFVVTPGARRSGLWTSFDYVRHIVEGLRAHRVPEVYIQHVIDVAIETNCCAAQKAEEQNRLIATLRAP